MTFKLIKAFLVSDKHFLDDYWLFRKQSFFFPSVFQLRSLFGGTQPHTITFRGMKILKTSINMLSVFTPSQWKPKSHEDRSIPDCVHMESHTGELEPQQGETILTTHKHSSAPRRTVCHILSNILSRISLTLGPVHAVTLRKITLCFSGVAGVSVLQEPHLMKRIQHCSTDRIAGKQLRHAQALLKSRLYVQWITLNSLLRGYKRNVFYYVNATWNDPVAKPG